MADERRFEDVVRSIEDAEDDVDTVLEAARLERHEAERLTGQQKFYLLLALIALLAVLGFFGMLVIPNALVRLATIK